MRTVFYSGSLRKLSKILIYLKHIFILSDLPASKRAEEEGIINEILNNLLFVFKVSF